MVIWISPNWPIICLPKHFPCGIHGYCYNIDPSGREISHVFPSHERMKKIVNYFHSLIEWSCGLSVFISSAMLYALVQHAVCVLYTLYAILNYCMLNTVICFQNLRRTLDKWVCHPLTGRFDAYLTNDRLFLFRAKPCISWRTTTCRGHPKPSGLTRRNVIFLII